MGTRYRCCACPLDFATRQGLEKHIFKSKKKWYTGLLPPGFEEYCATNNRKWCSQCKTMYAANRVCNKCENAVEAIDLELETEPDNVNDNNVENSEQTLRSETKAVIRAP